MNCQFQQQAVLVLHQPTRVRTISTMEPSNQYNHVYRKDYTSGSASTTQAWSYRPNQSWHNRWTLRGCNNNQQHRSQFSVVAALVPSVHTMGKRSRHSIDEVSKFEGAHILKTPKNVAFVSAAFAPMPLAPRPPEHEPRAHDVVAACVRMPR